MERRLLCSVRRFACLTSSSLHGQVLPGGLAEHGRSLKLPTSPVRSSLLFVLCSYSSLLPFPQRQRRLHSQEGISVVAPARAHMWTVERFCITATPAKASSDLAPPLPSSKSSCTMLPSSVKASKMVRRRPPHRPRPQRVPPDNDAPLCVLPIAARAYGWQLPEGPKHDWNTLVSAVHDHIASLNFGYGVALREKVRCGPAMQ